MICIRRPLRQENDEDQRNTDKGEGGAHGKGNGPDVREDVGGQGKSGAGRQGAGEDLPMNRRPCETSGDVRGNDTYESERAAEGRYCAGHQAAGQHRQDQDAPGRCP